VLPVALALAASFSWGLSAVFVRLGLRDVSTALGTLVSLLTSLVLNALVVLAFQLHEAGDVPLEALVMFGLVGLLNFPIGLFLNYLSMSHIGVGRSTPILASSPLFAMALAVVFTGEKVTAATAAGTALILAGLYVTLKEPAIKESIDAAR
jgi:drug/metabolite transporter (DMT)-like permease